TSLAQNTNPLFESHTLSLHDALPISMRFLEGVLLGELAQDHHLPLLVRYLDADHAPAGDRRDDAHPERLHRHRQIVGERGDARRSEEHTSELQSPDHLVCRLLLEKKK